MKAAIVKGVSIQGWFYLTNISLAMVISCVCLTSVKASNLDQSQAAIAERKIQQGSNVRQDAYLLLKQARDQIRIANQLNKDIRALQKLSRMLKEQTSTQQELQQTLATLNEKRASIQNQGAEYRSIGERLLLQGQSWMKQGFVELWGNTIQSTDPIQSTHKQSLVAHNTAIRSVKPNMPPPNDPRLNFNEEIPTLMTQRGDQSRPIHLDTDPFQPSRDGYFFAHIQSQYGHKDKTTSLINSVPINKMHKWHLLITDSQGRKVEGLDIAIEGHMPGHVHGLPTAPEMSQEVQPGAYEISGVKFQMTGWWVMTFLLKDPKSGHEDRVTFNLDL